MKAQSCQLLIQDVIKFNSQTEAIPAAVELTAATAHKTQRLGQLADSPPADGGPGI